MHYLILFLIGIFFQNFYINKFSNIKNVCSIYNELNTDLIHQKVYLGINPNTGSVITVNCQSKINGVIYIDALIQTTSAATDQGDLLTISKDIYGNLINVPKRIDAVLMGSDQNYFIVCKKDTGIFKVNGATIPAGTYKLILIIDP